MKGRIVLLGPPASGKGTQAEMIHARYNFPIASPGAIMREESKRGTALGMEAERSTSKGQLVPDAIVNEVIRTWLSLHAHAFLFDGYPRSLGQATALDKMLEKRGLSLSLVVLFEAKLQTIRDRVKRRMICVSCGRIVGIGLHVANANIPCPSCRGTLSKRDDDTPETLELRMHEYAIKTAPLIEYYRGLGILHSVDATRSPNCVFASIETILEEQ